MKAITLHGTGDVRVESVADPKVVDPDGRGGAHHHQRHLRLRSPPVSRARAGPAQGRGARPRVHGRGGGGGAGSDPGQARRPHRGAVLHLLRRLRVVPDAAAHPVLGDGARRVRRPIRPRLSGRPGRAHPRALRRFHVREGARRGWWTRTPSSSAISSPPATSAPRTRGSGRATTSRSSARGRSGSSRCSRRISSAPAASTWWTASAIA